MPKLTLSDIAGGYNAPTKINANNALIEAALENTLSRDGTSPNQMEVNLDMNSYRVTNLGSPQNPSDAARLSDITGLITLTGYAIPSLTGNANRVLFTDATSLYWGTIPAASVPVFTTTTNGAVVASGASSSLKALWGDGTWETPAIKANYAQTTGANLWTVAQRYNFHTVTYAGSLTIDTALGNTCKVTLTGNPTITLSNASAGRKLRIYLIQDGTGGRTVTWPTITWAAATSPVLSTTAAAVNWVDLEYDGTTWFGSWDQTGTDPGGLTPSDYDLYIGSSEKHVDVFRRLGSPVVAQTWEIALAPGVIVNSDSNTVEALDLSGAFPSGTIINILNQGYVIGKGGDGDPSAAGADIDAGDPSSHGWSAQKNGGTAIKGPATGVTVNITNAAGYVWGGGGGGGRGALASGTDNDEGAVSGAGGGGAGLGRGGHGATIRAYAGTLNSTAAASHGLLNLDGTAAGGAAGAASDSGTNAEAGAGGAGGDYGSAGAAGAAITSTSGSVLAATAGGNAGRAVSSGYAGTLTFVSGSGSPNVKGAV